MKAGARKRDSILSEFEHCQVLGPFNSGTALMNSYLRRLYQNSKPGLFAYWKHSLPPSYHRNADSKIISDGSVGEFPGVLFVCMVRSPYFWLPATSRRHYNLRFQASSFDVGQRLRSPVFFLEDMFTNLVDIWNRYYRRYAQHLEPLGRVIYVRLEDLVRNPRATIEVLDEKLQRKPGSETQATIDSLAEAPRKTDNSYGDIWEERNRLDYATQTLRNEDLSYINQQLDPLLMTKFGYRWAWANPENSR